MDIDTKFQTAVEQYQSGNMEQAEHLCREILAQQPDDVESLHLLGVIYYQMGNLEPAEEYLKKALLQDKDNIYIYFNLANVFRDRRQMDEAIEYYQKAIEIDPNFEDAYYNLGIVSEDKGAHEEALSYYQKGLEINPNDPDIYNNIGIILQKKGELDHAIACFQRAVQLKPDYALAYQNLGNTLQKKKKLAEALTSYRKALELNPSDSVIYFNLGTALVEGGQYDKAIDTFRRADELDPANSEIHYNMGIAFAGKGEHNQAIACYRKALDLNPDDAKLYNNLGVAFVEKGQVEDAISCYRKTIQIDPNDAEAHWNLSLALLLSGNFVEGWQEYEWRHKVKKFPRRGFPSPSWDGSDINGRSILVYAEQGFGDTIQFIRYAPLIAHKGARVLVECQRELTSLLRRVEGVERVIARGDTLSDCDFNCSLLSLPLVFGTTLENIPGAIPYIVADTASVEEWQAKFRNETAGLKVGLVWSGNPKDREDNTRSIPLDAFARLAPPEGVTFYSLQKGAASEQTKRPPSGMNLIDYTDEIGDFADTAGLIQNLDLVISVDTAVAHLTGAIGKDVWTLVPYAPDWRWMLHREDSPWYPTMRLFRQSAQADWSSVMERISRALQEKIASSNK